MFWFKGLVIIVSCIVALEMFSWLMHKYILHGPLWFIHKSHHVPHKHTFEINDIVAIVYAIPSFLLIYFMPPSSVGFWIGIGIAAYGTLYFVFHDIIIHRRIKLKWKSKNSYINRLIRAHKIHHKYLAKDDSEAFGFLYAPKKYEPKRMKQR